MYRIGKQRYGCMICDGFRKGKPHLKRWWPLLHLPDFLTALAGDDDKMN